MHFAVFDFFARTNDASTRTRPGTGDADAHPRTVRVRPHHDGRHGVLEHPQLLRHPPVALEQQPDAVRDSERPLDGLGESLEPIWLSEVSRCQDTGNLASSVRKIQMLHVSSEGTSYLLPISLVYSRWAGCPVSITPFALRPRACTESELGVSYSKCFVANPWFCTKMLFDLA